MARKVCVNCGELVDSIRYDFYLCLGCEESANTSDFDSKMMGYY